MISSEPIIELQRTDQWLIDRLGLITASKVKDVVGKTKAGSYLAGRDAYKWQLVRERITGVPAEFKATAAMQWGIDQEEDARKFYETRYDVEVAKVGFIKHPSIECAGASPDGLVGDDGLVEFKCMESVNHLRTIYKRKVPDDHIDQCQFQMAVTGRQWCDLTLYDPRMPDELQLKRFRLKRDQDRITFLETEILLFNIEIEDIVSKLLEQ
jgi:putative phage-type endonuclease